MQVIFTKLAIQLLLLGKKADLVSKTARRTVENRLV